MRTIIGTGVYYGVWADSMQMILGLVVLTVAGLVVRDILKGEI